MQSTTQSRQGRGAARWLAGGAAALVVLGLVVVMLALHNAGGAKAAGVTATTPPDAVHVAVVRDALTISTVPVTTGCPAGYICGTDGPIQDTHATVYDRTFADAATVRRLQTDLNGPNTHGGYGVGGVPMCGADRESAVHNSSFVLTYDIMFTARGQAVEHVVISVRCGGVGMRQGYAPTLALGAEQGAPDAILDVLTTTYSDLPHDPIPGGNLEMTHNPGPTPTAQPSHAP